MIEWCLKIRSCEGVARRPSRGGLTTGSKGNIEGFGTKAFITVIEWNDRVVPEDRDLRRGGSKTFEGWSEYRHETEA